MSTEGVSSSASSSSGANKQTVSVKSGAWKKEYEPGMTVGEYRKQLNVMASIPDGAVAYSGNQQLSDDHVMQPGESLEFIKKTGEKG